MKSKKIFLPTIILIAALLAISACSVILSIAKKPTVTEGSFPFSITYELNGETITIRDVYKVRYIGNAGYADTKSRVYVGEIGNMGEDNTVFTLKKDQNTRIELCTNFYPDYMMGDSDSDYFKEEAFEPQIYYYDEEEGEYSDYETLLEQGVKLIRFEYPTPIENSLVFSHISYFSSTVVFPTLLIALLSLIATVIFVKKEKGAKYKAIDIVSLILNTVLCFTLVPFVSLIAVLIDMDGGGPSFYNQVLYFIPSFSVLCIAASVAFRRIGWGVKSLVASIISPAVFVGYLIICGVCGLL
jgi:hypothetical protein